MAKSESRVRNLPARLTVALVAVSLGVGGTCGCRGSGGSAAPGAGAEAAPSSGVAASASAAQGTVAPGSSAAAARETSKGGSNLILPAASVAAFQDPAGLPAYSGPTGSVEGTIFVQGDPSPDVTADFKKCPTAQDEYGKLFREGPPTADGSRPLADAFVGVTGYSGFYIPSHADVRNVTIANCGFTERTIDMTIGEHIEVFNHTKKLYAPVLAQIATPAIMIAPPFGDPVKLYPNKPAYYTLLESTGSAPYMVANVYVVAYPLHTVSGRDGHYRIDGLPVGKLEVSARLAAIRKTAAKPIEVLENVVSHVDLVLNYRKPNAGIPTPVIEDAARNQNY